MGLDEAVLAKSAVRGSSPSVWECLRNTHDGSSAKALYPLLWSSFRLPSRTTSARGSGVGEILH